MNPSSFMRIPSCNFHCPSFICFSKSSPSSSSSATAGIQSVQSSSPPIESENAHPASDSPPALSNGEEREIGAEVEIAFKSCIRSGNGDGDGGRRLVDKKKVQWMDNLGFELVDIREFEASDSGEDEEEHGGCFCVIA